MSASEQILLGLVQEVMKTNQMLVLMLDRLTDLLDQSDNEPDEAPPDRYL